MSDKLFDFLIIALTLFILGTFAGEYLACKKLGLNYSWDYGRCIKEE